ncbi:MAG: hypothetical protein WCQ49_00945 [Candidatus Saccharibacteria bacterium]
MITIRRKIFVLTIIVTVLSFLFYKYSFAAPAAGTYVGTGLWAVEETINKGFFHNGDWGTNQGTAVLMNQQDKGVSVAHVSAYSYTQNANNSVQNQNNKQQLITYIEKIHNMTTMTNNGATPPQPSYWDSVGAEYIIQTARGANSLGQYDRSYPLGDGTGNASTDDITDWRQKVLNTDIIMASESYTVKTGSVNTRMSLWVSKALTDVYQYKNTKADQAWDSLVFYKKGDTTKKLYVIKRACANPLGYLPGLSNWGGWTISANSSVKVNGVASSVAKLGDKIKWTHTLNNDGPSVTTTQIHSNLSITGFVTPTNAPWGGDSKTEWAPGNVGAGAARGAIRNITDYSEYTVLSNDKVGAKLCQNVNFDPISNTDVAGPPNYGGSTAACVTIINPPPPPIDWKVNVGITNNKINLDGSPAIANPGDTIVWTHTLENNGPDATNKNVNYYYQNSNSSGVVSGSRSAAFSPYLTLNSGSKVSLSKTSDYTVLGSDVGKDICRVTIAEPGSVGSDLSVKSGASCVKIPYNFTLDPVVILNPSGVIEPGSSSEVKSYIDNKGSTVNNPLASWVLTKTVNQPGLAEVKTTIESDDATKLSIPGGGQALPSGANYIENDTDKKVGTKICYKLAVSPYSSDVGGDGWKESVPVCITIGKRPKVQIWGGDLISNGKIVTSSSLVGTKTFGSWIEYGIFAKNSILGAGSRSAYSGVDGLTNTINTFCDGAVGLSFANVNCTSSPSETGYYSASRNIPDISASFPGDNLSSISSGSLSGVSSGVYTSIGDLELSGGTIEKGNSIIINNTGKKVTISGDINYTSANYSNIGEIPQLIIIADNIDIKGSVINIDAWLIAKEGAINTCSDFINTKPLENCDKTLQVNGPIAAKKLYLMRTAGSNIPNALDPDRGSPAEIFNLRSDAYLWASNYFKNHNQIQTVYTTELPPRF